MYRASMDVDSPKPRCQPPEKELPYGVLMLGSNANTFELAFGTAIGNVRVNWTPTGDRSLPVRSTGRGPRLLFCWLRVASMAMPGLPPETPVKSLIPPR